MFFFAPNGWLMSFGSIEEYVMQDKVGRVFKDFKEIL